MAWDTALPIHEHCGIEAGNVVVGAARSKRDSGNDSCLASLYLSFGGGGQAKYRVASSYRFVPDREDDLRRPSDVIDYCVVTNL